jgi:CRISPR-associated protein Cas1
VTFVTVEHGLLHASGYSLQWERETGTVVIPVGMATVILIEPGVTLTHAAVKLCADQGTLLLWIGEAGVRIYSAGQPGGGSGERILQQAALRLDQKRRIAVARRFYERMFGEMPPPANDIEKLRGLEGAKVKQWYKQIADHAGVTWEGREKSPKALRDTLGYATATLYGISEAVILAAGLLPAIGFIHSGDARSLVFDLADTIKFQTVVPAAFQVYMEQPKDIRSAIRRKCRDLFREYRVIYPNDSYG